MSLDGVLVVDKPKGPTSHDVVSAVRKALNIRKVGHTGTLDPAATGLLPLVLGKATKVARYLTGTDKSYDAVLRLGAVTPTLDGESEPTEERPVNVDEAAVRAAAASFVGDIEQLPPMYSAKKIEGKRLYELARQGVEIEREPKMVTVHELRVTEVALPEVALAVRCSAGTYVRVLAHDIGQRLGCGAYLASLRRTAVGHFDLSQALSLDDIVADPEAARDAVLPLTEALASLPRIAIPSEIARLVASGHQLCVADLRTLDVPAFHSDESLTLSLRDGRLVAIVRSLVASEELSRSRRDQQALKTERVLLRT